MEDNFGCYRLFTLGTLLILRGVNEATYYDGPRGQVNDPTGLTLFLTRKLCKLHIVGGIPAMARLQVEPNS